MTCVTHNELPIDCLSDWPVLIGYPHVACKETLPYLEDEDELDANVIKQQL